MRNFSFLLVIINTICKPIFLNIEILVAIYSYGYTLNNEALNNMGINDKSILIFSHLIYIFKATFNTINDIFTILKLFLSIIHWIISLISDLISLILNKSDK